MSGVLKGWRGWPCPNPRICDKPTPCVCAPWCPVCGKKTVDGPRHPRDPHFAAAACCTVSRPEGREQ